MNRLGSRIVSRVHSRVGVGTTTTPVPPELWTPNDGNAYMWFDLNDSNSVTFNPDTKKVSLINDKTGNFVGLVQGTAARQGLYDEVDKSVSLYDTQAMFTDVDCDLTNSLMFLTIGKQDDVSVACNLTSAVKNFDRNNSGLIRQTFLSTTKNGTIRRVNDVYSGSSILYDDTTSSGEMRMDGSYDVDIEGTNVASVTKLALFNSNAEVTYNMKESIWYNKYDPALMEITEGYAFWNNGLESLLPSNHKYKTAPPYKHFLLDGNGVILEDGNGNKLYTVEAGE